MPNDKVDASTTVTQAQGRRHPTEYLQDQVPTVPATDI